mmetsp:Transcript_20051/g.49918  ORF Transcript_20051/g.49918 Transcript_20051/m.49918 type:complete len:266 (+) Transcript_20051:528-1325(+)
MPAVAGSNASPVVTSNPTLLPLATSSVSAMQISCASYPLFSASVLGMISIASANASTPRFARPSTVFFTSSRRCTLSAASNAPAPSTTARSCSVFFTARRPSRTASLSWDSVWSLGPFSRIVHEVGFATFSTKVYFSSPSTCSYTSPACPSTSGDSSSGELMQTPPHDSTSRSMLRFLARRRPTMPSLASMSSEIGSMPFCVITTNPFEFPSHTFFFSAMTWRTTSSVYSRSAATMRSRWSASEYMKLLFTSDFSYSKLMLHVRM